MSNFPLSYSTTDSDSSSSLTSVPLDIPKTPLNLIHQNIGTPNNKQKESSTGPKKKKTRASDSKGEGTKKTKSSPKTKRKRDNQQGVSDTQKTKSQKTGNPKSSADIPASVEQSNQSDLIPIKSTLIDLANLTSTKSFKILCKVYEKATELDSYIEFQLENPTVAGKVSLAYILKDQLKRDANGDDMVVPTMNSGARGVKLLRKNVLSLSLNSAVFKAPSTKSTIDPAIDTRKIIFCYAQKWYTCDCKFQSRRVATSFDFNLPNLPQFYVGRARVEEDMVTALMKPESNGFGKLLLVGLAGMGKSTVTSYFIHRGYLDLTKNTSASPCKYRIWFNAEDPRFLMMEYKALLREFGDPSEIDTYTDKKIKEEVIKWLSSKQVIIVYDNVKNSTNIASFLPSVGQGYIIVTSRDSASFINPVKVGPMTPNECTHLMNRVTGKSYSRNDLDELLQKFEFNVPLALLQASAYIKSVNCSLEDYIDRYKKNAEDLLAENNFLLPKGLDKAHIPVLVTWRTTMSEIKKKNLLSANLLDSLAFLYPKNIETRKFVNLLPGSKAAEVRGALEYLIQFSMINSESDTNLDLISVHRLVQLITATQCAREEKQTALKNILNIVALESAPDGIVLGGLASRPENVRWMIEYYHNRIAELSCANQISSTEDEKNESEKNLAYLYEALGCCYSVMLQSDKAIEAFDNGLKHCYILSLVCDKALIWIYKCSLMSQVSQTSHDSQWQDCHDFLLEAVNLISPESESSPSEEPSKTKKRDELRRHQKICNYMSELEAGYLEENLKHCINRFGVVEFESLHLAYYLLCLTSLKLHQPPATTSVYEDAIAKFCTTTNDQCLKFLYDRVLS